MKRTCLVLVFSVMLSIGSPSASFANPKKQIKILVKLSDTETVTLKGTKSQLAKRLKLEAQERAEITRDIKVLEECDEFNCSDEENVTKIAPESKLKELKEDEMESTKIIDALAKSIYGPKVQDASNLKPLTKSDFKYFIIEVEYQIYKLEKELTSLRDRSNPALIEFLTNFENTNYPKAGYSKEYAIDSFEKNLIYQIRNLNKVIVGLENLIKEGNPEGISEMKVSQAILLAEGIASGNENLGENLESASKKK